ncbi:sodium- and chloride-dependent glycine transporter 1-like [Gigantopelta aegis]|uniref:sodium- and chloride-dependent glycine transporter 1-like n=1 Tax=Gigantopelta aegis TaxID=1735272 RepID=UPI001B88A8A3|nr:sodium- and chloride-dependent glycine transporter 1-like [Gigantopelta aegis]
MAISSIAAGSHHIFGSLVKLARNFTRYMGLNFSKGLNDFKTTLKNWSPKIVHGNTLFVDFSGAFFIPYVLFLVLCGVPLFFLEVSYGQFSNLSPIAIWRICPLFKGVGIGMVIVSSIVCIYYNVIIAWALYYLVMSFRAVLPWSNCNNEWNTEHCVDVVKGNSTNTSVLVTLMTNMTNAMSYTVDTTLSPNMSRLAEKAMSASEEFWERHVLELSGGIEEPGTLRWQLVIALFVSWVLVFLCLFKGVSVLGKVMHFAAPFPYLVLTVLLIRGVTLPGAMEGIKFYIIPRWEKLASFRVWGDAALQIFYSVGMAWGGIITMASYNKFNHNVYRDSMMVPFINCGTSIFAGFVIFSVLGFMAHEAGVSMEDVVTEGPGLTFVAYPQAIAKLPISPLWSVLFFLMLLTIGLDSQFGMFETMLSGLMDEYPHYLRNKKTLLTIGTCLLEFLLGLACITQGGIYVLQIMDWYCASFSLMLISLCECLAISWIYGADRFYKDIEMMIGYKPPIWWKISWKYITPAIILFIWLFSVTTLGPVTYGDVIYPTWAIVFGWCLAVCSIIPIPVLMIYQIAQETGPIMQRIRKLTKPSPLWGPSLPEHRKLYLESLGITDPETVTPLEPNKDEDTTKSKPPQEHLELIHTNKV